MKEEDLKRVVKEAVHETLDFFGFTVDDHLAMREDLNHVRKHRLGCEAIKETVRGSAVKIFVTVTIPALLLLLWESFKNIRGH